MVEVGLLGVSSPDKQICTIQVSMISFFFKYIYRIFVRICTNLKNVCEVLLAIICEWILLRGRDIDFEFLNLIFHIML